MASRLPFPHHDHMVKRQGADFTQYLMRSNPPSQFDELYFELGSMDERPDRCVDHISRSKHPSAPDVHEFHRYQNKYAQARPMIAPMKTISHLGRLNQSVQ